MDLQPFQQRVVDEQVALETKVTALEAFLGSETFTKLPMLEQGLLVTQLCYMKQYNNTLQQRIAGF